MAFIMIYTRFTSRHTMIWKFLFPTLIFTVFFSSPITSNVIPVEKVREIVEYEEKLISALGNYIQEENEKENEVDEAIQSFHLRAQEENLSFELNPVDIFRLHRRVVDDWDLILEKVLCEDCSKNNGTDDVERALYRCQRRTMWPRESDVTDAAMALVRLSRVYKLDTDDIVNGHVADSDTGSLTLDDILFIADVATDNGFHYEAVQWLKSGISKAKQSRTDEATVTRLYRELAAAYHQVQMPSESVKLLQECAALYPESKSVKRELQYYKQRMADASKKGENSELTPRVLGKALTVCEHLCRGESESQSPRLLFCRLRATDSPFTTIKEEILSWKPRIIMVHEVLSPQQTEYFTNISADTVERSGRLAWAKETTVSKTKKDGYELDEIRTSLVDQIMNVTGLTSKRYLQAVNLGLGENLKVKKLKSNLDTYLEAIYSKRFYQFPIARWMYFLSDTTGGDVVFPDLNLKVPSIKGNAVYWYNLKPNGDPETRTRHCICPALLGSPWVSSMNLFVPNNLKRTFCGRDRYSPYSL